MEDLQMNTNESIENTVEEVTVPKKKNNGKVILIVVAAFLVLGVAAYLTGKLMNGSGFNKQNGPIVYNEGGDGLSRTFIEYEINEEWPEEIPTVKADVSGVFVERKDNLLKLGTGNLMTMAMGAEDGSVSMDIEFDGPEADVLITPETQIYRDTTFDDLENGFPENGETIKHTIEDGTLEEITENTSVMVWGRKSGDRYVADVVLYTVMGMVSSVEVK